MIGDLSCKREPLNHVDRNTVAVLKDDTIVRHSRLLLALVNVISRCLLFEDLSI